MKKITIMLISLLTVISIASCDSGGSGASDKGGAALSPDTLPAEDTLATEATGDEVEAITDTEANELANSSEIVTDSNNNAIEVNDLEDVVNQTPEEDFIEDAALNGITDENSDTDDVTSTDVASNDSTDQDSTTDVVTNDSTDQNSSTDVAANDSTEEDSTTGVVANDSTDQDSSTDVAANDSTEEDSTTGVVANDSTDQDSSTDVAANDSTEEDSTTGVVANDNTDQDSTTDVAANDDTEEDPTTEGAANENITPENILDAMAAVAEDETDEALSTIDLDIDIAGGRWYQIEQGVLPVTQSNSYNENLFKLNELREKLVELRTKISSTYDENELEQLKELRNNYLEQISEIREIIGYGSVEKGIYTAWANQEITIKANNVEKAGWYRLRIVAKNTFGPLPGDYDYFNIAVKDTNTNQSIGAIQIKASDDVYQRGSMLVYLKEGNNELSAKWTNDAYKKNTYDANIQIKRISLGYAKFANDLYKSGYRTAHQFSSVEGRFFWDDNSVRTNWAYQTLGFAFTDLEPGKYKVVIEAKNYGSLKLPKKYHHFNVDVTSSFGTSTEVKIPASDNQYKKGQANINMSGGNAMIYITWMNDSWLPGKSDANIQIKSVSLVKIGKADHSALAAYLMGTAEGHRLMMILALVASASVIGAITYYNKKRFSH